MEASPGVLRYDFLDSLPLQFICSLCRDVLYKPQLVSCCKKYVCEPCIKQTRITKEPCPLCKSRKFSIKSNPVFNNKLNSFQILCTNKGCNWSGPLGNLDNHLDPHRGTCEYATISCPLKCGITLSRHKMSTHTCSTSSIVSTPPTFSLCPCHSVGCSVVLSQDELHTHINDNLSQHVKMLADYALEMRKKEEEVAKREEKIKTRETELAALESQYDRTVEIIVHKDLLSTEKTQKMKELVRKVEELQVLVDAKNTEIENLCLKVSKLEASKRIESQYVLPSQQFDVFSYRFIMNNFNQYCAIDRGKLTWQSDPFYTHTNGYKMTIIVDVVLGLLRVSLCILPGKHDDQLTWPLQGSITISLLNQLDNYNHYDYHFIYNGTTHASVSNRVASVGKRSEKNVSLTQKISCDDLPLSQSRDNLCYLKNNTLKFSISKIDLIL